MNPSQDQVKSAVRTFIASLGGVVFGWAVGKGWISTDQATAILSNTQFLDTSTILVLAGLGGVGSLASGIWGAIVHRPANLVATVAAMPEVAEVKTTSTQAGVDLANAATAVGPIPGALITIQGHT